MEWGRKAGSGSGAGRKKRIRAARGEELTATEYLFYGHMMNMNEEEVWNATIGHMADLVNCLAIYRGAARKKKRKHWTFDEAIELE